MLSPLLTPHHAPRRLYVGVHLRFACGCTITRNGHGDISEAVPCAEHRTPWPRTGFEAADGAALVAYLKTYPEARF